MNEQSTQHIVWLVATEHVYNLTNIGLNIHSDMLCNVPTVKTPIDKGSLRGKAR